MSGDIPAIEQGDAEWATGLCPNMGIDESLIDVKQQKKQDVVYSMKC